MPARRAAAALVLSLGLHVGVLGLFAWAAGSRSSGRPEPPAGSRRAVASSTRVRLLGGAAPRPAVKLTPMGGDPMAVPPHPVGGGTAPHRARRVRGQPASRLDETTPLLPPTREALPESAARAVEEQPGSPESQARVAGREPPAGSGEGGEQGGSLGGEAAGSAGGDPGGDAESMALAELHRRLAAAARRCYPNAARRFRARGTVMLSFCLEPGGGVASASVAQGSGSALLDRAAADCVLPGALPIPGVAGCYTVPIIFGDAP